MPSHIFWNLLEMHHKIAVCKFRKSILTISFWTQKQIDLKLDRKYLDRKYQGDL